MATRTEKSFSRRTLVNINRDPMTMTPRVIWDHEKPILEELFGQGNVLDVDPKTLDDGYKAKFAPSMLVYNKTQDKVPRPSETQGIGFVFAGNADNEYQRLMEVYGRHKEENVYLVEKIYGRAQSGNFARLLGKPELSDLPETQLRGIIIEHGYAQEPHKDASADEKNHIFKLRKDLSEMPIDGLVKVAKELEVTLG